MNPVKRKLAQELTEAIKGGMNKADSDTSCAKALEALDLDALLEKDVNRLCDELSTLEAGKVLSLGNRVLSAGNANVYKRNMEELRSLVLKAVKRVEKKFGGLSLPKECRDLLTNLL
jgi:hypothetical protein